MLGFSAGRGTITVQIGWVIGRFAQPVHPSARFCNDRDFGEKRPRLTARSRRTRLGRAYAYGAHSVGSQWIASLGCCLSASRAGRHKIHWLETLDQYPIASLSPRLRRTNLPYLGAVSIGFTDIPRQVRRDNCPCIDMRDLPSGACNASLEPGDPNRSDCALSRSARAARGWRKMIRKPTD